MFMLQAQQQQQQQQQQPPPQQQQQPNGVVDNHPSPPDSAGSHQRQAPGQQPATLNADEPSRTLLSSLGSPMERSAPEYSQSDHASAATPYANQEVRSNNYSSTATPTSEYGVFPQSARSGSFPEHIQRAYHPASSHGGGSSADPSIAAPTQHARPSQQVYSTPEEFKEIRKEWKARKKEEEAQRKAEEERHRQAAVAAAQAAQNAGADPQAADGVAPTPATYPGSRQGLPEYGGSHVYSSYQTPASPYAQPNQGLYNQHNGGPPNH
ncbi:hypothetical protein P8C59_006680 [Phyllachora maydis]|uniref:Uncharacterized protein n=1 Tax=Phyllachora maydis TaxID=1825666 RepID=A0AAD9I855_9PEZI|nr:hypothetical protein P8C59_006680 [Phyllachora maydis]